MIIHTEIMIPYGSIHNNHVYIRDTPHIRNFSILLISLQTCCHINFYVNEVRDNLIFKIKLIIFVIFHHIITILTYGTLVWYIKSGFGYYTRLSSFHATITYLRR
jgi:hypothetical protein